MRRSSLAMLLVGLSAVVTACSAASTEDGEEGGGAAISEKNLARQDFGLADHELVLTLDDGPGPRTKELVDFLVEEQVPAVFFMMGNAAKANTSAMNYVAEKSRLVPGGLLIGNHSLTHTTPLPKQGVDGTVHEIQATDEIIGTAMKGAQDQFQNQIPLFRPPYGAFTSLGAANIAKVNARGGAKYLGPIFWDIGGELTATTSADWACWGKVTPEVCRNGYIRETEARGKGIILAHDIHSKTIDMLTGRGTANGVSLIKELRSRGFKFVGLRAHEDAIARLTRDVALAETRPEILATAQRTTDGTVEVVVDLAPTHAVSGVVTFDGDDDAQQAFQGATSTVRRKLSAGQHVVTITALDAEGKVVQQKRVGVVVPADMVNNDSSGEHDHAPCVNYDNLTVNRPFKLFIKKVDCGTANAVVGVPGECYAFDGTLKVAATADGKAAVRATGGAEWSVEYDLGFKSDPNDLSKLSLVLETGTGSIITGKRHAFHNAAGKASTRADVPFTQTAVDCSEGIWRGTFNYANGTTEAFLFRKPNAGEL